MDLSGGTWKLRKQDDLNYIVGNSSGFLSAIRGETPMSAKDKATLISYAPEMYETLCEIRNRLIEEGKLEDLKTCDISKIIKELKQFLES